MKYRTATQETFPMPSGRNRIPPKRVSVSMLKTDPNYLTTYKIPMQYGAFFTKQDENATNPKVVLNETAAKNAWME